jgi:hypothetical protein
VADGVGTSVIAGNAGGFGEFDCLGVVTDTLETPLAVEYVIVAGTVE